MTQKLALVEANVEIRQTLALLLTSTGGFDVTCFARITQVKDPKLVIVANAELSSDMHSPSNSIIWYSQTPTHYSSLQPLVNLESKTQQSFSEAVRKCLLKV